MKKLFFIFLCLTFIIALSNCNSSSSYENQLRQSQHERQCPGVYLTFDDCSILNSVLTFKMKHIGSQAIFTRFQFKISYLKGKKVQKTEIISFKDEIHPKNTIYVKEKVNPPTLKGWDSFNMQLISAE